MVVHRNFVILPRGIQLTHVQLYWGSTVKMLFFYSCKIVAFPEANVHVQCGAPERLPEFGARTFLVLSKQ
jgi:hypothetical protein